MKIDGECTEWIENEIGGPAKKLQNNQHLLFPTKNYHISLALIFL